MIDWVAFNRARSQFAAQRWRTAAAGACAILSSVGFVALILILGALVELLFHAQQTLKPLLVQRAEGHWYGPITAWLYAEIPYLQRPLPCLILLLSSIVLIAVLRAAALYLQSMLVTSAVVDATCRIRRQIYRQAYRLGTTEVSGIGVAPAIHLFTRETDAVRAGLVAWLDALLREPLKLLLLLAVAVLTHWALALLFLVLAVSGSVLARRVILWARSRVSTAVRSAAQRLALLQESLYMIRLTRGYLMEAYENERFERNLEQFALSEKRQMNSTAAVLPLIELLVVLCVTLVSGLASFHLLVGALSAAATLVLYASLLSLYWPISTLARRYQAIERGAQGALSIFAFLDQHSELGQVAGASFLPPMSRALEFVGVRLQEPGQPPVLDQVQVTIAAGSRVAIMGLDERAKRAIVYLIPRFLDPTEGQVRIDGQDVRLVTLESLRAQVALVLQGELVISDTVAGNIGCGEPSYRLPHIVDAAKLAHAHQFIQRLPKGYDTLIGDMGESLTLSQQFRIALARAILRDPTIVVIEEPLTHLDEDSKHLLDDTLARFCPGRTVIFLPHRLSTIRTCDSIVILHNGKVETIGNHRELTLNSELYRHLQYTEFNVFATG
jgi:ATP-binding cassette subfamily B protein